MMADSKAVELPAKCVAVILGSAFNDLAWADGLGLEPVTVTTKFGDVVLHVATHVHRDDGLAAVALLRHGVPHTYLPHQIPYRAQAAALKAAGCTALLITSSCGVLDATVPLYTPLLVTDLLMPENRLPNGEACTMFTDHTDPEQGHLLVEGGLFNGALGKEVVRAAATAEVTVGQPEALTFVYSQGPRTKTPAENQYWAAQGAQVNSMTVGPEVVLANELEIPTAAVVIGHKYSLKFAVTAADSIATSLDKSQAATVAMVIAFLQHASPVPFANKIYRFHK